MGVLVVVRVAAVVLAALAAATVARGAIPVPPIPVAQPTDNAAAGVVVPLCAGHEGLKTVPKQICETTCDDCIKAGGVWCDSALITTMGLFGLLDSMSTGSVCGTGSPFHFDKMEESAGVFSGNIVCQDPLGWPRANQCSMQGYLALVIAFVVVTVVCLCCCAIVSVVCGFNKRRHSRH